MFRKLALAASFLPLVIACEKAPDTDAADSVDTKPRRTSSLADAASDQAALQDFVRDSATPAQPKPATPPAAQIAPPPEPAAGEGLKWTAPAAWETRKPASRMRQAEYRLPGADASEDAELAVFYFGPGQGGGVEANLVRWRGQFTTETGGPVPEDAAQRGELQVGQLPITWMEVSGTYAPSPMSNPGGATQPRADYAMLAAVVEAPGGARFFKATGPKKTIDAHRAAFFEMLNSVKVE